MGSPVLLLRLEGPLQSWGGRSRWDVRDTQPEPTKSGVVGLLGCALGYERNDRRLEEELDAGLRFGVRVEQPGRVLRDYQTVTDFLPTAEGTFKHSGVKTAASLAKLRADAVATLATIISPRFYLEDAAFLVGLEERAGYAGLLERCAAALAAPVWPIFLGRKTCVPSRPVLEALTSEYEGLEDALSRYPWSWHGAAGRDRTLPRPPESLEAHVEAGRSPDGELAARQDAVRVNVARQYGFRFARRLPPISFTAVHTSEETEDDLPVAADS